MSRKKFSIVVFACALVVIAICGVVWASGSGRHGHVPTSAASPPGAHSTNALKQELTVENIRVLETSLNSPVKVDQVKALVPALRSGTWSNKTLLPVGAVLTIDRTTFKTSGASATVLATVSGSTHNTFMLYLAMNDGQWLIYETKEVK